MDLTVKAKIKNWKNIDSEYHGYMKNENFWVVGYYVNGIELNKEPVHVIIESGTEICNYGESRENHCYGEIDGWYIIDLETLCRCTGCKDANDRVIWENDIIREGCNGLIRRVVWDSSNATFKLEGLGDDYRISDSHIEWEVIGNVFDNPDLLP